MLVIKVLSVLTLIGSVFWFINDPDYEPAIVAISSLTSLMLLWVREKNTQIAPSQSQSIAENGFGIQAGGDVSVGNVHLDKEKSENVK